MNWQERRYCGSITLSDVGNTIQLSGWIDTIRDHGKVLFMHIRDTTGFVQIVIDPSSQGTSQAESLRSEYCVTVKGCVAERSDDTKNPHITSGNLEIHVETIEIHSTSKTPPFMVTEKTHSEDDTEASISVDEDLRLAYRFLDIRRPSMQHRLKMRYKILKTIRDYLDSHQFCEVETPILTKSTPEGARDYLVPSRIHHGNFYALPQSPQLFKQLLMVGGMDRYFQIVKCFRDEDLRPNRQPEFTQLDLEASFIDETFIFSLMEGLMTELFSLAGKRISTPFPHITYKEAMETYGSDKPDLRFDMPMVEVTDILKETGFKVFQSIATSGGCIKAINVKKMSSEMSKNMLQEEMAKKVVPSLGGKGMAWMRVENGALNSNIVQFFSEKELDEIASRFACEDGDVLLFIADKHRAIVNDILGRLRLYVASRFGFIDPKVVAPCWVTNFPLFECKENQLTSIHHPFTAPSDDFLSATTQEDLLKVSSRGYDMVINGEEIGGGSIRIHDSSVQQKVFETLGLSSDDIKEKFGWFVDALTYGTPPHGGIALGIDRLVGMLLDTENIREVIAFPKNRVAYCPLTHAPSPVSDEQLDDVSLSIIPLPEDTES